MQLSSQLQVDANRESARKLDEDVLAAAAHIVDAAANGAAGHERRGLRAHGGRTEHLDLTDRAALRDAPDAGNHGFDFGQLRHRARSIYRQ
jgi:hypothetical protein